MWPNFRRVVLKPLEELGPTAWRRINKHLRDPEIAQLNGTSTNRMPVWLLKRVLRADSRRADRETFGIFDQNHEYIGTIELYDIRHATATLGIIIGERSHWSRGYGPESIHALMDYAFNTLGLERIRLATFGDNPRAQAAFKKVGFWEVKRTTAKDPLRIDVKMELNQPVWLERYLEITRTQPNHRDIRP
jgi:RimJ/RimL family protein N-acetyltransferase